MRAEERIRQLEAKNTALREQLAEALEQLGQALGRIHELEGQVAKDSHNSSRIAQIMLSMIAMQRASLPTPGCTRPRGKTLRISPLRCS